MKIWWVLLSLLVLLCIIWATIPPKLIYRPTTYPKSLVLKTGVHAIEYETSEGKQVSFHLPATEHAKETWMLFSGNGSLALQWMDFLVPQKHKSFVLFEYPGFGKCEGTPSPESILESAKALREQFPADPMWNVMGFSLGGATALAFAAQEGVAKAVIISTFTSIREMIRRVVGQYLSWLPMSHNFDNRANLRKIRNEKKVSEMHLLHGDLDQVIPVNMGHELHNEFYDILHYHEIPGAGHTDMLSKCWSTLAAFI